MIQVLVVHMSVMVAVMVDPVVQLVLFSIRALAAEPVDTLVQAEPADLQVVTDQVAAAAAAEAAAPLTEIMVPVVAVVLAYMDKVPMVLAEPQTVMVLVVLLVQVVAMEPTVTVGQELEAQAAAMVAVVAVVHQNVVLGIQVLEQAVQ